MESQVWWNGKWCTLSGSLAEFKDQYYSLCGVSYSRAETDNGLFGGYYEGARFEHTAEGETGGPTGSKWNE